MRWIFLYAFLLPAGLTFAQADVQKPFKDCRVKGSTTIYDLQKDRWIYTDSLDARLETLPASTFKVINLLIALQTKVIKDENEIIRWAGITDTAIYGYRPDIYRDMSVKEAFRVSAGWVFIELAKKIGRERYQQYLKLCGYGNGNLTEKGIDFWNIGAFAVSPINQVQFLVKVYNGRLPFAKRNVDILKRVMLTEQSAASVTRSKTGWTRADGKDWGWWIGYIEQKGNAYFFATRIYKDRSTPNYRFADCRKDITKEVLRHLKMAN